MHSALSLQASMLGVAAVHALQQAHPQRLPMLRSTPAPHNGKPSALQPEIRLQSDQIYPE